VLPCRLAPLRRPILSQRCGLPSLSHSPLSFLACTPPRCARFARVNHPSFFRIKHVHLTKNKKTEPLFREIPSFPTAFRLQFSGAILLNETDSFFCHLEDIDFFFPCQAVDSENSQRSRLRHINHEPTAFVVVLNPFLNVAGC